MPTRMTNSTMAITRGATHRGRTERLGIDAVGHQVGAPLGPARRQRVHGVEYLRGADNSGDKDEEHGRAQHRQGDVTEPLPVGGAVGAGRRCGRRPGC